MIMYITCLRGKLGNIYCYITITKQKKRKKSKIEVMQSVHALMQKNLSAFCQIHLLN